MWHTLFLIKFVLLFKIKRKICIYVSKMSLTEKFFFGKTLLYCTVNWINKSILIIKFIYVYYPWKWLFFLGRSLSIYHSDVWAGLLLQFLGNLKLRNNIDIQWNWMQTKGFFFIFSWKLRWHCLRNSKSISKCNSISKSTDPYWLTGRQIENFSSAVLNPKYSVLYFLPFS